jgi:preprotein translocase subunit SecB
VGNQTEKLGSELSASNSALLSFVSGLHLKSVELQRLTSDKTSDFAPPATLTTELTTSVEREEDGLADVLCHYSVRALPKGTDTSEASMSVVAVYSVHYAFGGELTEEFRSFLKQNALMTTWPYFRHVVQTCTSDMGLPPLTIDLVRATDKPSKKRTPR